jgi:hypothetical protein
LSEPVVEVLKAQPIIGHLGAFWQDLEGEEPLGEATEHKCIAFKAAVFPLHVVAEIFMEGVDNIA